MLHHRIPLAFILESLGELHIFSNLQMTIFLRQ